MKLAGALKGISKELQGVLKKSLNPSMGLINSVVEEPLSEDQGLGLHLVHAVVSPPTYYRGNRHSAVKTTERGTGAAFSKENATWAAIGEALERYAASIYWPDHLIEGSAADLAPDAISLRGLIHSGRSEVRLFNPVARRAWAKGTDLATGRPVLVPAAMTWLGYEKTDADEIICQNDSTGLACGQSQEGATLSALCEVVERDVFASNWLLARRPPRLMVAGAIERLDMPVQLTLRSHRLSVKLYYLARAFGVHVVMCVVESPSGIGVVGAAASPFILRAVEKAVTEGLYSWSSASRLAGKHKVATPQDIKAPTDHLFYYTDPKRYQVIRDLCAGENSVSLVDLLEAEPGHCTVANITDAMAREGLSPAMVDLTTADVASLDMSVVRVVVPGLQPLIFGASCTLAPDQRRLNQWRTQWGIRGQDLNPHIHPFP